MSSLLMAALPALLLTAGPGNVDAVRIHIDPGETGVLFAARILAEECGCSVVDAGTEVLSRFPVRAGLIGDPALDGLAAADPGDLGREGFGWRRSRDAIAVFAATPPGLMYGLLELADRLHNAAPVPEQHQSKPTVALRGDDIDLPMYLGNDLYDGRWSWSRAIEASPDSWFHDRPGWTQRFRQWARRRKNTVLFSHPHPFPGFISYPDAPEAAYFDAETVARNAATLQWLIEEGGKYGLGFYFLIWNEWVPRGYAEAHGILQEGPGTPESAALNRYSYSELFGRFPGLAGLVTMAGESPPGCTEFVRSNVVRPLAELPRPPHIVFWTWCAYPEDVNFVLDGYPGQTSVMHYLQYEQLFLPQIDPRVGRMSQACGGRPIVTLGGLGCATGMLYWGSPEVIRRIMQGVPGQNVGGVLFSGLDSWSWVSNKWIGWEALARYWWDPFRDDREEEEHWRRRIAEVLGHKAFAAPLLRAYEAASDIPMRMLHLTHSQSDVFRPQYGLPLVFYLGMPTISTYVFENHERIDERGYLTPRLGLTWPNPDWGIEVIGVRDYVEALRDKRRVTATTPLEVAAGLEADAEAVAAAVAEMRPLRQDCAWGQERFDSLLGVLTMNELLARHYAAKTRAAVAWQQWSLDLAQPQEVLEHLDASVTEFRRYAETTVSLYPGEFGAKINFLSKAPPWTHHDLWSHYVFLPKYDFLEFADRFARERDLIAEAMAADRSELPYALDLIPPLDGSVVARIDHGIPDGGMRLHSFPDKAAAAVEAQRLVCRFEGTRESFYFPVTTDIQVRPLERNVSYELIFRYEILTSGTEHPLQLSIGARTTEGGWRRDVGARYFSGPAGTTGEIRTQFTPVDFDDYYVYVSMNGNGQLAIENLRLIQAGPR